MATVSPFLLLLVLLSPLVIAKDIDVGGGSGWTNGFDYSDWASKQTFNVNDKLVFSFGFTHSLDEVNKDDYDNCNIGKSIDSYTTSPATVTLSKAGTRYFICPRSTHCSDGMKLAVNVVDKSTTPGGSPPSPPAATTPSPPDSSSPDTPPSSGTPPSTRSGTTAPPSPTGGAVSTFGGNGYLMVGRSLVLATLLVFMA